MPVIYHIDRARNLILTRCVGPVTLSEVLEHFRALKADPACPAQPDVLLDLRELQSLPESSQLTSVVDEIQRMTPTVRFGCCSVIADRDVLFGMMRVFSTFAEDSFRAVQVFRTVQEAEAWLNSQQPWRTR